MILVLQDIHHGISVMVHIFNIILYNLTALPYLVCHTYTHSHVAERLNNW